MITEPKTVPKNPSEEFFKPNPHYRPTIHYDPRNYGRRAWRRLRGKGFPNQHAIYFLVEDPNAYVCFNMPPDAGKDRITQSIKEMLQPKHLTL